MQYWGKRSRRQRGWGFFIFWNYINRYQLEVFSCQNNCPFYSLIYFYLCLCLEPPQLAPFQFPSETVDEGKYVQISCSVVSGDEPLQISWSLHGDGISSDPSIITTMIGTRSSILIISKVGYRHSGEYTCRASNSAGSVTHSDILKVNGNHRKEKDWIKRSLERSESLEI